jgi:hypothetical protein
MSPREKVKGLGSANNLEAVGARSGGELFHGHKISPGESGDIGPHSQKLGENKTPEKSKAKGSKETEGNLEIAANVGKVALKTAVAAGSVLACLLAGPVGIGVGVAIAIFGVIVDTITSK